MNKGNCKEHAWIKCSYSRERNGIEADDSVSEGKTKQEEADKRATRRFGGATLSLKYVCLRAGGVQYICCLLSLATHTHLPRLSVLFFEVAPVCHCLPSTTDTPCDSDGDWSGKKVRYDIVQYQYRQEKTLFESRIDTRYIRLCLPCLLAVYSVCIHIFEENIYAD